MKRKLFLVTITIVCSCLLSVYANLNLLQSQKIANIGFLNVEALADDELPPEVRIQCLSAKKSDCVVGRYVVTDAYYSPH